MRPSVQLGDAAHSLFAHPLRSLLTVLGVVTGVAAVIVVIAAGEGSRRTVMRQLELLGSRLLIVLPGSAIGGGRQDSLTREDAAAIEQQIAHVRTSPEVLARALARRRGVALSVPVVGASAAFAEVRNFKLSAGRFFSPGEERGRARVCVLGQLSASRLFPHTSPLDQYIKLEGVRYQVIGIFEPKGDLGWFHPDELAVIPLATAQTRLLGIDYVHAIAVECPSQEVMPEIAERVVALLRRLHRVPAAKTKDQMDFHLISQKDLIESMARVSKTLTALLISLAAVALVTGGVGIMNIMLVSVTERTAEIGLRKAVGATGLDVFIQFLIEAMILSGAGALIGVAIGASSSGLISDWGGWDLVISLKGVAVSVSVALMVGLVFGIYPALRAAALEPVEALRS